MPWECIEYARLDLPAPRAALFGVIEQVRDLAGRARRISAIILYGSFAAAATFHEGSDIVGISASGLTASRSNRSAYELGGRFAELRPERGNPFHRQALAEGIRM